MAKALPGAAVPVVSAEPLVAPADVPLTPLATDETSKPSSEKNQSVAVEETDDAKASSTGDAIPLSPLVQSTVEEPTMPTQLDADASVEAPKAESGEVRAPTVVRILE